MTKAVAKTKKHEVAAFDTEADAGKGAVEGADKDSYATPFLQVLQSGSPQIVEKMKGAQPGMLINTVTNELFNEVHIIPFAFQRVFIQWTPRDEGGGFRGFHSPADVPNLETTRDDKGQLRYQGDILKDTRNHWVLVQSKSGNWFPAILSLSSTQIKKSKLFMSAISNVEFIAKDGKVYNPASYANIYKIMTKLEKNEKGSWYGVEILPVGPVTKKVIYEKAKAFALQVASGEIKAANPDGDSEKF